MFTCKLNKKNKDHFVEWQLMKRLHNVNIYLLHHFQIKYSLIHFLYRLFKQVEPRGVSSTF